MIMIIRVEGEQDNKCLVVGNPKLPSGVAEQWGWSDIPYAAQEASLIGEIMQVRVRTNSESNVDSLYKGFFLQLLNFTKKKLPQTLI